MDAKDRVFLTLLFVIIVVFSFLYGFKIGEGFCKIEYREKQKEGLVEYYDELNQKWLWKKGEL